jgi:hypothetical protein
MDKLFDATYMANMKLYMKHAKEGIHFIPNQVFTNKEFYEINKEGLDVYLEEKLSKLTGNHDLFPIASSCYLYSMIYLTMGEDVILYW